MYLYANTPLNNPKMVEKPFDVFLAHRSSDKSLVREIYFSLKNRGVKPWLDEEEIPPGASFQDALQQATAQVRAAAICIGLGELGRWQAMELKAFISQCIENDVVVIPVLLPGTETIPEKLIFLRQFHAVSFRKDIDESSLSRLIWGITGKKPENSLSVSKSCQSGKPLVEKYDRLRTLLESQDWQLADEETSLRMVEVAQQHLPDSKGYRYGRSYEKETWSEFPCADLKIIDGLWRTHSQGQFGFSVQKEIWSSVGGVFTGQNSLSSSHWDAFGRRVGWIKKVNLIMANEWINYNETVFSKDLAPRGHLPFRYIPRNATNDLSSLLCGYVFTPLMYRVRNCGL